MISMIVGVELNFRIENKTNFKIIIHRLSYSHFHLDTSDSLLDLPVSNNQIDPDKSVDKLDSNYSDSLEEVDIEMVAFDYSDNH